MVDIILKYCNKTQQMVVYLKGYMQIWNLKPHQWTLCTIILKSTGVSCTSNSSLFMEYWFTELMWLFKMLMYFIIQHQKFIFTNITTDSSEKSFSTGKLSSSKYITGNKQYQFSHSWENVCQIPKSEQPVLLSITLSSKNGEPWKKLLG